MNWKLPLWAVLATGAAGVGGYYAYKGRDCISGQAAVCEKERADPKARSGQIEATLNQMQGNLSTSRQELEALRKWKGDAAKRMQTFRDMSAKLQKMVDAGKLGVRVRDGRLVMRLPQDVLFPSGVADLSREGELALMEVAVILKQFPDRRFMVAGHTDNQPVKETYKDNWELSMARALVVTRFLVEAKMKPQNIVAAGYGEHDPIAKNATPEGRRENRRIEIILLPDLSELPTLPEDMATQVGQPKPEAPPAKYGAPSAHRARRFAAGRAGTDAGGIAQRLGAALERRAQPLGQRGALAGRLVGEDQDAFDSAPRTSGWVAFRHSSSSQAAPRSPARRPAATPASVRGNASSSRRRASDRSAARGAPATAAIARDR